ncbi:MAG: FtsQ-type POTRA domain-containing protein [Chloroflexi bacterium]|nr:FtsQ-type POTRA domain-containing protein [Chloroflexota bacterium]
MTSKLRENRRATRTPAIWRRRGTSTSEVERAPIQQAVRGRFTIPWRLVSGLLVATLLMVLALLFSSDAFYVHSIAVGGLKYMSSNEIFTLTNVTNMHIFWVDPEQVRADILKSPTIADAQVRIGWPPNMVQIIITEREPALVWEQAGTANWIDLQGRVMRQRENRPGLLRVQVDASVNGPVGVTINPDIVTGAVQLQSLLPGISVLRYHPDKGLGYNDQRGWEAWMGTGSDMSEKIHIYNAIVSSLQARNTVPNEINVANPDSPFYSVLAGS